MKRLIATLLTLCMSLSLLTACGGGERNDDKITESTSPVEIVLPASLFSEEEDFDVDAYAKENGYLSASLNEDGSLTVTMTKEKHQEQIAEIKQYLEEEFSKLVGGENTPYIKEITGNEDFSVVTVKVDREDYENAFDLTSFTIGMSVYFYHIVLGQEYHCQIDTIDAATGDTIDTVTYPDALNS